MSCDSVIRLDLVMIRRGDILDSPRTCLVSHVVACSNTEILQLCATAPRPRSSSVSLSATAPWPRSSGFSLSAFVPRSTSWFWSCSPSRAWSSTPHYASALPPSGLGGVWDSFGRLEGAYVMTSFGVCFMFLFSFLLFCNLIHAVSVMLPVPSCISALCMCHVVIWLFLSCVVFLIYYCSVMWFPSFIYSLVGSCHVTFSVCYKYCSSCHNVYSTWSGTAQNDQCMTSQYHESYLRADGSLCFWIALAVLWYHTLIILRSATSRRIHLLYRALLL